MTVLLFADHNNKALNPATAKALTAALAIAPEVDILVAGLDCRPVAEAAARLAGARKVFLAEAPHLEHGFAEELAALTTPLMESYDALVAPSTTTTRNFTPRVAALLDVPQISDISAVKSPAVFERPIYAGNAIQTVEATTAKMVVTVRSTSFAAAAEGGAAPIEAVAAPPPAALSAFVSEELSQSDRPELTAARVVISGGRGMQSAENFKLLDRIAGKLNAAVGASRAAVDAGFAPNDFQVGQTGKAVAPDLYIAVGISGAIQHLAGMKDSKVIVAINKDEEAPIFQVADYGLVADLFQALPEFEAELDKTGH
jgi:electron transfer flavoprotein alpha subunit